MTEIFINYGLFVLKTFTIVFAIFLILVLIANLKAKNQNDENGFVLEDLNEFNDGLLEFTKSAFLDEKEFKKWKKAKEKESKKSNNDEPKAKIFVLDFHGDIEASAAEELKENINLILQVAQENDQVLLRLESGGGLVYAYGFASSQLHRLRAKNIKLVISVDKIAASGGYMMACLADEIIAAPFAILGSIGVVAAIPNFNKLLKKHDIDYEQHTAGKYKRTLTVFGENTPEDREQFLRELEITHELFKAHIKEYRPQVNIDLVATGETWYGTQALQNNLIDKIGTSDDFILQNLATHQIYLLRKEEKVSALEKIKNNLFGKLSSESNSFKSNIFKTFIK